MGVTPACWRGNQGGPRTMHRSSASQPSARARGRREARRPESSSLRGRDFARWAAAAALSVGAHVVGKSARDALYLASYPAQQLPYFLLGSAALSALVLVAYTRASVRLGPGRVAPATAVLTAMLLASVAAVEGPSPRLAAAVLFGVVSVFGTLLMSGLWAMLAERLDPRSARRIFGALGAATTAGGLLGGVLGGALVQTVGAAALLPAASALSLATAIAMRLARGRGAKRSAARAADWFAFASLTGTSEGERTESVVPGGAARSTEKPVGLRAGIRGVASSPYLRSAAVLGAGLALAATIADYLLKDSAARTWTTKEELASFFSMFHGAVGALTFAVQIFVCRPVVARHGIRVALFALPGFLLAGGLAAFALPAIAVVTVLRAGESALRNSFHRAGYELMFLPLSRERSRLVKPVLDSLVERGADVVGALFLLAAVVSLSAPARVLAAIIVGFATLTLVAAAWALRGYVATLRENLDAQALELDNALRAVESDATARETVRLSLAGTSKKAADLRRTLSRTPLGSSLIKTLATATATHQPVRRATTRDRASGSAGTRIATTPVLDTIADLLDPAPAIARRALANIDWRDRRVLPFVTGLLADDELAPHALVALRRAGDRIAGTLGDCLLDPSEPLAVRRRIPEALAACTDARAAQPLLRALSDGRAEVRVASAEALFTLRKRSKIELAQDELWAAFYAEARRARSARSRPTAEVEPISVAGATRGPQERSADGGRITGGDPRARQLFRLLGVLLDPEAVALSYRALHSDDAHFRAVALEYLENVLTQDAREAIEPWLLAGGSHIDAEPPSAAPRSVADVVAELHATSARVAQTSAKLTQSART